MLLDGQETDKVALAGFNINGNGISPGMVKTMQTFCLKTTMTRMVSKVVMVSAVVIQFPS